MHLSALDPTTLAVSLFAITIMFVPSWLLTIGRVVSAAVDLLAGTGHFDS